MHRQPQRNTLATQAAIILREDIQAGVWAKQLPGEYELCARLNISRVTLRSALAQLQREGVIDESIPGKRRKITGRKHVIRTSTERVVLLTPLPLHELPRFVMYWIDDLREHLADSGHPLELHSGFASYTRRPDVALEALAKRLRPAGWVLYLSTAAMQKWFANHGLPCVITGSRHPGVALPAVDVDYRAVARHAVGLFLARGHQRIAFLGLNSGVAGDKESELGFLEGLHKTGKESVEGNVIYHDGTTAGICAKLAHCLRQPNRPTAFLVARPHHTLTVITYLLSRGIRIPADAALISRDDDQSLNHVVPTVARYFWKPTLFARRISNIVMAVVRTGVVKPEQNLVMPEFVRGQTLG